LIEYQSLDLQNYPQARLSRVAKARNEPSIDDFLFLRKWGSWGPYLLQAVAELFDDPVRLLPENRNHPTLDFFDPNAVGGIHQFDQELLAESDQLTFPHRYQVRARRAQRTFQRLKRPGPGSF
jgi:hypothetical protein